MANKKESWSSYSRSEKDTRDFHYRYLMIINNTERRAILRALVNCEKSFEEIVNATNLSPDFVKTQLEFLEWGFCIERFIKDGKEYFRLTKEGEIIKKLPE